MLMLGIVRLEFLRNQPADLSRGLTPLLQGAAPLLSEPPDRAAVLEVEASLAQLLGQPDAAKAARTSALEIRQSIIARLFPGTPAPGAEAVKVGNGVSSPKLTSKREPQYGPLALFARWQGTAILSVVVGVGGSPHQ